MTKSEDQSLGLLGEEMAALYLREKGLRIVEQRVRFKHGEIDIVARDGREWVFVEVKTRSSNHMGMAAETLTTRKAKRMERAIREYLFLNRLGEVPTRCDFVAIDLTSDGPPAINHFPAAFTWK